VSRVLVVANETVGADELLSELRRIEDEMSSEFFVVAPALAGEHGKGTWSQAGAIEAARARLDRTLGILRSEGLNCQGEVGDMLPVSAIRDALRRFPADRIVISTHPEGRSGWLRRDLIGKIKHTFDLPVQHVISHVREEATPPA
jgi:GABA permease